MKIIIHPSKIDGKLSAPTSKSVAQRAIAIASITKGASFIKNITWSDDVIAALSIAESLGSQIKVTQDSLKVEGGNDIESDTLNCNESGLCMRMFAPIAALFEKQLTLIASGSLLLRPAGMIEEALNKLGVSCTTNNGKPPIKITGPIKTGNINIDASISSQLITGLLISLPTINNDSFLEVDNLVSKQYVDVTLSVMNSFGVSIKNNNYKQFVIKGNQTYKPAEINIEGDWSSSSFLLVAAAISGKITITNLSLNSFQPDKNIIDVLEQTGAKIKFNNNTFTCKHSQLKAFNFDATDCPDLFPPLVALASNCNGKSTITGINRLIHKESNRLEVLIREFSKMGVKISQKNNSLEIERGKLISTEINPENDHRIAMAAAIAYLGSNEIITINQAECVRKSYPGFWEEIKCMGIKAEVVNG
ncbi:MAG: 3-phosphoshikimate 1-carboxyvinyltransferase [Bacteroidia bacterium]|nr:3-phosphoshikimate 1-carboxyvinyltransferase [Bacteroidia bacterium]